MTVRTLYVDRPVENADELRAWAAGLGLPTALAADRMHVTVCFSQEQVDWAEMPPRDPRPLHLVGGVRVVKQLGKAVVLRFTSRTLQGRWQEFQDAGASHGFPDYQPHISLTFAPPADFDPARVAPYAGPLRFGPERFQEINDGWKEAAKEVPLVRPRMLLRVKKAA